MERTEFGRRAGRTSQRGAAALAVSLVLLFGMTLVAFFANRGLIFEQKTSANQYRSTRAFEMAEAGLEWAVARLNDDLLMAAGPSCATTGTVVQTFADRYLPVSAAGFATNATRSGCSIAANGATSCSCPAPGNAPTFPNNDDPRFTVIFNTPVGGDPWAVEVVSTGCTNGDATCSAASTPDAVAVVRSVYKMKPAFPNAPGAGLIAGSSAYSGGNLNVINTDPKSNGVTINAGTAVTLGGSSKVVTLPGTPPSASILDNDNSLNDLTNADATGDVFFTTFFGESMQQYKDNPKTWVLQNSDCGSNVRCSQCNGISCGTAIVAAYAKGIRKFWSDAPNITFNNSNVPGSPPTLGSPTEPIAIATANNIELKGDIRAYGMFYAATATADLDWDYTGSGTAQVFGAFITRGNFDRASGTLDLIYDPNIFKPENLRGVMVRVPGSWRDKSSEF